MKNANNEQIKTVNLYVEDMCCLDECNLLEKKVKSQRGIQSLETNLESQKLKVSYNPSLVSIQDIIKSIAETGMKVSLVIDKKTKDKSWWRQKRVIFLIISGILTGLAYLLGKLGLEDGITHILYIAAIVIGGYYPIRIGLSAVRTMTMNINTLLIIATIGAVGLDLWEEAAVLVFIYSLGGVLEAYAVDKARGAIRVLLELAPKEALVKRNGEEMILPTENLSIGDIIVIRPGEKIPLDGKVVAGSSFIDQAPITGEPIPVEKKLGEEVFAGTINQRGSLEVAVTKKSTDTTLSRIIHSVEEAQAKKSSYQRFGEKFGKYYTPAMFALGIGVALVPPLLFGGSWSVWFYRALVVFVVSCSCGLALSVPVSVVAAITNAARHGVIFKGGAYLELANKLKAIAFDKTGTLTLGRPVVTDVITSNSISQKEILTLAGSIESRSEHPLAEAIVRKAKEGEVSFRSPNHFEALAGMGVKAKVDGKTYYVGSRRLFQDNGIPLASQLKEISRFENEGKTVVLLGSKKAPLGIIAIADSLRIETKETISSLNRAGIKTVMLTGDNEGTAKAIASQAGVSEYLASLLPEDKVKEIKKLKKRFGSVAMVGDGINDAPAMALSDVGIAMGAAGTDVAMETGDIVLMSDDLTKIDYVINLSRRAISNIRLNIIVSLVIIAFLVPSALTGKLDLVPGLLINEIGALIVIVNGLRLLR